MESKTRPPKQGRVFDCPERHIGCSMNQNEPEKEAEDQAGDPEGNIWPGKEQQVQRAFHRLQRADGGDQGKMADGGHDSSYLDVLIRSTRPFSSAITRTIRDMRPAGVSTVPL
jgi:hypothetical protein